MLISMFIRSMLLINNIGEIMYKLISKVLTLSLAMGLAGSVFAENILEEIQSRGEIRMAIFLKSASPLQRPNAQTGEAGYRQGQPWGLAWATYRNSMDFSNC